MPRYFYVRSNGSNSPALTVNDDTPYTSMQTGAFPADANCYSSIEAAIEAGTKTNPAADGDFILLASDHDKTLDSAGAQYDLLLQIDSYWTLMLTLISVSPTNCDQYEAGATERMVNSGSDHNWRFNAACYGINWYMSRLFSIGANSICQFFDCYWEFADGSRHFTVYAENSTIFHNCRIVSLQDSSSAVNFFSLNPSSTVRFYGGSLEFTTGFTSSENLFNEIQDGCEILLDGVDLSTVTSSMYGAFFQLSTAVLESLGTVRMINCKLNASPPDFTDNPANPAAGGNILITGCGSGTEAEYQRHWEWRENVAYAATNIYRNGSEAYPSGQQISIRVDTKATCGLREPFFFPLTQMYVDLSATASDTLKFYLLSADTLTDAEVWIELLYPDGSVAAQQNFQSSKASDILNGSTLTTNTESWTGYTSQNRYEISFDTASLDAGDAGIITARVCVAKPSATIYICPTPELS